MTAHDRALPKTIWRFIIALLAGWAGIGVVRIAFSAETNAPKLLGAIILAIMSIPLCTPPLVLGLWGMRNSRVWPGIVGIIWFVAGIGVIWVVYGSA